MKLKTKFQDEDFDLWEVIEANFYNSGDGRIKMIANSPEGGLITIHFDTLKEINDMFEDYEEPKEYWFITDFGGVSSRDVGVFPEDERLRKEIGNYFETEEKANKAAEKLKAWKRLKDKGFKFGGHDDRDRGQLGDIVIYAEMPTFEYDDDSTRDDLDLLFGGEE